MHNSLTLCRFEYLLARLCCVAQWKQRRGRRKIRNHQSHYIQLGAACLSSYRLRSVERKQSIGLKWFLLNTQVTFFFRLSVSLTARSETKATFQTRCKQITQFVFSLDGLCSHLVGWGAPTFDRMGTFVGRMRGPLLSILFFSHCFSGSKQKCAPRCLEAI